MVISSVVMLPLRRMWDRVAVTAEESDVAYFYDLLNLGELLTKLVVSSVIASIEDREGNRYKLEHDVLRADSLGDWVKNLQATLTGPSSTMMRREAQPYAQEITQNWTANSAAWQRDAVELLYRACYEIDSNSDRVPQSVSLREWFSRFVWLRNRTKGHGSPLPGTCATAVEPLANSLRVITNNLAVLKIPCAVIRRNLSGKYRVVPLTELDNGLEQLKRAGVFSHADGVYYSFDNPCYTPLCLADIDLSDIQIANGSFRSTNGSTTYEVLSYTTDYRTRVDGSNYLRSVTQLPNSETHGYPDLEPLGETFTNLPPQASGYVTRATLEQELRTILINDRHPVISLVGRGGIGKTSLALKVLHELCNDGEFEMILWFSARDIDLLSEGPKDVRPQVLTFTEMAKEFTTLIKPYGGSHDNILPDDYLARVLSCQTEAGPMLLVVDNFETVRNPKEMYQTLDTHVRLPNKVLITGRHREFEFKADYPVEVTGMTRSEYDELVQALSVRLNLSSILSTDYLNELYQETEGHPYVTKVMLGEVAKSRRAGNVRQVLATRDRMLDALFERSYATLSPGAQRVFLTLCNWRSSVTRLELEATLSRPYGDHFDASDAVDMLQRYSMVEPLMIASGVSFLRVPEAARVFGTKKLRVSPMKPVIDVDTAMLQSFGTVRTGDIKKGFGYRVDQMVYNIAKRATREEDISEYMAILEYMASDYPHVWLNIASLRFEYPQLGNPTDALDAMERYLQEAPDDADAWKRLAAAARRFEEPDREMNALYRLANLPNAPLEDVSNAARCLSRHLASGSVKVGWDEKRLMASQLAQMMNSQRAEAKGTDFSRLAWLYLHLSEEERARECVSDGLKIDRGNRHLLMLDARLG